MMEFEYYSEYKQHVSEMWVEGHWDELESQKLLIVEAIMNDKYKKIRYRLLTEEEFKEKFSK